MLGCFVNACTCNNTTVPMEIPVGAHIWGTGVAIDNDATSADCIYFLYIIIVGFMQLQMHDFGLR